MDELLVYERELKILNFIFSRVSEDIDVLKLDYDITTLLEKLCVAGLITEEERQRVISSVTHNDKNK